MSDAKAIRQHTAQHDLFNRIHSIGADETFVRKVSGDWYERRFEVVPNQRCGTWYCDPSSSSTAYAYFKSTDGHTNNWNFNLRRSNLPFAKYAEFQGGVILVDSTRRGKRMPDALSKTVPIWCAVINLALCARRAKSDQEPSEDQWDTTLYLPPNIVSPSERSQIEALLPEWAEELETSVLPLPDLAKPLRPFFIHPSTSVPPHIPENPPYIPIICLSASRWVGAGDDDIPRATKIGWSTVGFEYVPGAGDDDELWARGLKPALYHARRKELLTANRDSLPDLVDDFVNAQADELSMAGVTISDKAGPSQPPTRSKFIGIPTSDSYFALDLGPPVIPQEVWSQDTSTAIQLVFVEVEKPSKDVPWILPYGSKGHHIIALPNPKSDGWAYSKLLKQLIPQVQRVRNEDRTVILRPGRLSDYEAALRLHQSPRDNSHEKDQTEEFSTSSDTSPQSATELVSARKALIPVAVTLLCSVSNLTPPGNLDFDVEVDDVDKSVVAAQLHRLVALWPNGNPPRAALKRINEVLMSGEWDGTG